jgi:hypothetical protein
MKRLLLIIPILVACKSTKNANCEAYGDILKIDTLQLERIHTHLVTDSTYKCIYFPEEMVTITWWAFKDTSTQVQTK